LGEKGEREAEFGCFFFAPFAQLLRPLRPEIGLSKPLLASTTIKAI
jgi:hypothetical protein